MMNFFTHQGKIKDLHTRYKEYIDELYKQVNFNKKIWGQSATSILIGTPMPTPIYEEPKKPVKKKNLPKQFLPKPAYRGAK
jgi:hypothetical protein